MYFDRPRLKLKWGIWPLLGGLAAFNGCAHYAPQPLLPDSAAAQFDARRLDDPALKTFITQDSGIPPAWPLAKWDLNSLTLAAFYFHPDLAVARAQWEVAEAGTLSARARPNPSLTFTPSYDAQIPNNPSPWILPVTFDLPLETAGKRGKRMAQAEAAAQSARWSYVSAAWQVRRDVRASLLAFDFAGRRADLLRQEFAAQTNLVRLLDGQLAAGAVSRPELTLAEIAVHKTQLDLNDAESQQADARSQLARSVGVAAAALDGVNLEFDFPTAAPEVTATGARGMALRQRADILGALADYAAADASLRLEIARQYPDLHLGPGYAWNNGNANDNQWSLGATLELPILDQNQGPIAEAAARRKLAAAKFTALQAQVCSEIDRAIAGVRVAREQLRAGDDLRNSEERQLQSVTAQIQAGAADQSAWLNARLESANAALAQLDSEEKLQSAVGALEDALQSPADQLAAAIQKISAVNPNRKGPP
jgi:outer membrane protein TolC